MIEWNASLFLISLLLFLSLSLCLFVFACLGKQVYMIFKNQSLGPSEYLSIQSAENGVNRPLTVSEVGVLRGPFSADKSLHQLHQS